MTTMRLDGKNRAMQIGIHTLGWGLLFCAPLFFNYSRNTSFSLERYLDFCIVPLTFMALFYLNYFLLIDRMLFRKRLGQFILVNLLLMLAANVLQHIWHEFFRVFINMEPPERGAGRPPLPRYTFVLSHSVMMALVIGLSVAIRVTGNWYRSEAKRSQAEKERTQAELKNLRSQLNPHFLFNTLNNIYALIQVDPPKAQYAVHGLSNLLRYVLYENNEPFISLDKEFEFMRNYVDLMRLRLSPEHTNLSIEIPEDGKGFTVAPLLFITLVENAFKHGINPSEPSFVRWNAASRTVIFPNRTAI